MRRLGTLAPAALTLLALSGCSKPVKGTKDDVILAQVGSSFSDKTANGHLAIDANHVYWTAGVGDGATLMRVPKAGGAATTLAKLGHSAGALVVEQGDAGMAFVETEKEIVAVPKAGGAPTTLFEGATNCVKGCSLAIDSTAVFFTDANSVRRVNKTGGPTFEVALAQESPHALAQDATHIYWFNSHGKDIRRTEKIGGKVEMVVQNVSMVSADPELIIENGNLYFIATGVVFEVPVTGGTPRHIAKATGHKRGFALDGNNVWFTRAVATGDFTQRVRDGGILRAPRAGTGGEPTPLFLGEADPNGLAVDEKAIYWIGVASIMKTPKPP